MDLTALFLGFSMGIDGGGGMSQSNIQSSFNNWSFFDSRQFGFSTVASGLHTLSLLPVQTNFQEKFGHWKALVGCSCACTVLLADKCLVRMEVKGRYFPQYQSVSGFLPIQQFDVFDQHAPYDTTQRSISGVFPMRATAKIDWELLFLIRPGARIYNTFLHAIVGLSITRFRSFQSFSYSVSSVYSTTFMIPQSFQEGSTGASFFKTIVPGIAFGLGSEYALSKEFSITADILCVRYASQNIRSSMQVPFSSKFRFSSAAFTVGARWTF